MKQVDKEKSFLKDIKKVTKNESVLKEPENPLRKQ